MATVSDLPCACIMKAIGCLCILLGFATAVRAAQLFYEPFDYSNVGQPVSQNEPGNWTTGGGGADDTLVTAGSLSFPGLAPSIGNSITNGGAGIGLRRFLGTSVTSGTVYFSVLFNVKVIGPDWSVNNSSAGALTDSTNSGFKVSILLSRNFDRSGYVFGVQKGGMGTMPSTDTTSYFEGSTVLLIGSYTFDPDNPDVVNLWINPDSSTFGLATPPAATLSANTGTDTGPGGLDRFNFRQNLTNSLPQEMQWDELRVGETWADVTPVPEPSAALFVALGTGAAIQFRRPLRRRQGLR